MNWTDALVTIVGYICVAYVLGRVIKGLLG